MTEQFFGTVSATWLLHMKCSAMLFPCYIASEFSLLWLRQTESGYTGNVIQYVVLRNQVKGWTGGIFGDMTRLELVNSQGKKVLL